MNRSHRCFFARSSWAVLLCIVFWSDSNSLTASPSTSGGSLNPQILDSGERDGQQGWAVDISGNLAIVGAPFYEGGSAYIFDLTTGDLLHRLTASDSSANALFGFSVAIDDGLAVVASGQRNAAYIFDATTGQQLRKLTPTTRASDYVRSVDISNGVAVLGTPTVQFGGALTTDYGAAFLYNALTGAQIKRINGPTTFNKRGFGRSVAIDGDTVAITSPSFGGRDDVYVVNSQTGELRWSYGRSTTGVDFYAKDVVIDGNRVVVGGGSGTIFDMPTAYVFDRTSGTLMREIDTRVANENDGYREQLDVSGDRLVVGSWGTYENGFYYTGAVHSFNVANGGYLGTIKNPDPMPGDEFGFAVAFENGRLLVGAPGIDTDRGNQGLSYFYLVPEPTALALAIFALLPCISGRRWGKRKSPREGRDVCGAVRCQRTRFLSATVALSETSGGEG